MKKTINFGIGFLAGRPNVCTIINNYHDILLKQFEGSDYEAKLNCYILFDTEYLKTERIEFYNVKTQVYQNIEIKYISPESISEEKKKLESRYNITKKEAELILGLGYAKSRNTIMYYALKEKVDYLLYWDDDEYPVASVLKENKDILWIKQKNLLEHCIALEQADVTTGYRCGFMAPIPIFEYNENVVEDDFKKFISGVSNEAVTWETVEEMQKNPSSIVYANYNIANGEVKATEITGIGKKNWVLGSGLGLNLKSLREFKEIPVFYNPPGARGEDAFYSIALNRINAKVMQVPTYHFHDSFLRYTEIMKEKFPKNFKRLNYKDGDLEERFRKACIGWVKYKPLLIYLTDRKNYTKIMKEVKSNLEQSIPKMNTIFPNCNFDILLEELYSYDENVRKHYNEYTKTTEIWNKIIKKLNE